MLRKCSEIFTSLKTLNSLHILQIVKCTARDTTHKYYIITLYSSPYGAKTCLYKLVRVFLVNIYS